MVVFKRKDKGTVIKEDHKIQTQRHYWFAAICIVHFYLLKMIMYIDMTCMMVCKRKDKERKTIKFRPEDAIGLLPLYSFTDHVY